MPPYREGKIQKIKWITTCTSGMSIEVLLKKKGRMQQCKNTPLQAKGLHEKVKAHKY